MNLSLQTTQTNHLSCIFNPKIGITNMNKQFFSLKVSIICWFLITGCQSPDTADVIYYNGNIYTVDPYIPIASAFAVKGDTFMAVGDDEEILMYQGKNTKLIDLGGQFVMPGLIEGHGHFSGTGKGLLQLDFLKAASWEEIVEMVANAAKDAAPGEWIEGRGWHQEKWLKKPEISVHGYPLHDALSEVSPNNPVILRHASGHSLFANKKAMQLAGVNPEMPSPSGGEIVKDASGQPIGVFEERAMRIITSVYQEYLDGLNQEDLEKKWYLGIEKAQDLCLRYGVTSFQDAGSSFEELERYREMAEKGQLRIKLWAMARHSSEVLRNGLADYPIINAGNGYFTCRAIKSELDGALGVFGAWKLKPYADKPDFMGQNTTRISELKTIADLALKHQMQLCVHAIGDRANREFLDMCDSLWQHYSDGPELRWRSEHAQHLDTADIKRFAPLGIFASMQGIHCTSDAPFVVKRLGTERSRTGAYAWRSLLDAGVIINNGTDVPVEEIDPFACLYASVTRRRTDNGMEFFTDQAMTRSEAIYSYTMANALAAFEEDLKGSISPGKRADFIILDTDLLNCTEEEILKTKVLATYVDGIKRYNAE
jgi:predicted amidohydrolase YtcJ